MRTRLWWALGLSASLASGCVGDITGADGDTGPGAGGAAGQPGSAPVSFQCDESAAPAAVALRRLSVVQLDNTVRDLLRSIAPTHADAVIGQVTPILDAFPVDVRKGPEEHWGGFTRVDQKVAQQHADRAYELATKLGSELAATDTILADVAGACATDGDDQNDATCLSDFIRSFGERALRRKLDEEDIAFYSKPAGDAPFDRADWADVIAVMLGSPYFFYFVEHGQDDPVDSRPDLHAVGAYELASRLSYHFWQTLPDDELLSHARSGKLLEPDVYEAQADRLFKTARARDTISQFYSEWFRRGDVRPLNSLTGTAAFDTLRGSFDPSASLHEDMFAEVTDMALYYSLDKKGSIADFYRSKKSFARTQELADFYSVPVWDGKGEPPDFTEPERQGLLTRAAMVATGIANTRPIMKGVFIRRALLCDKLPPPPANVMATTPEPEADATSRQVVEDLTGGGSCKSCHAERINPLGFATENFDALGRPRKNEQLIDLVTGSVQGTAPVNTEVRASVTPEDDTVVQDGVELQEHMLKSGKLEACFARAYFRFTFGRTEDVTRDACALKVVHEPIRDGGALVNALRAVVSAPAFKQRNFADDAAAQEDSE